MFQLCSRLLLLAAALFLPVHLAIAQETGGSDPVVARVNGEEIRRSDVRNSVEQLPASYRQQAAAQFDAMFPLLLQRTIDFKLLGSAARDAGMADDEEVKRRLKNIEEAVMREVFLEKRVVDSITEEMLQERYQAYLKDNPPQAEIRARHILVEEKAAAQSLIDKLDEGADFVQLAKDNSIGPSASQGGDLNYFSKEQMVPEFAEAAFALESGSYTAEPVQTQFGWHVILVVDRRDGAAPAFEQLEQQLLEELSQEALRDVLEGLRKEAEIELIDAPAAAQ